MEEMLKIEVEGELKEYQKGITYQEIAKEYQNRYEDDILLVLFNHRLRELWKTPKTDGTISFVTAKEEAGKKSYRRSVTLLLQKAVDNLYGKEGVSVRVCHSLGQGYYCELRGMEKHPIHL